MAQGERLTATAPEASHAALAPMAGQAGRVAQAVLTNGRSVWAIDLQREAAAGASAAFPAAAPGDEHAHLSALLGGLGPSDLPVWTGHLRDAGIWADRPNCPDLLGQLHQALRRPVDTILCTLLDNDPAARLNGVLAARYRMELLAGVALLARLTRASRAWIAAEAAAPPNWWKRLRRLGRHLAVDVLPLRNDYPQSDPSLLLYSLLDRRLRPRRSPVERGVLLLDAAAAVAIGQFVLNQQPMLRVPLAVHDRVHHGAHFVLAPVGMAMHDALAQIGITMHDELLLRSGDLLRNRVVPADAIIGGGELVIHVTPQSAPPNPEPCIRCSWCVESCPVRIQPAGLLEAAQRNDAALAEHYGLEACIECGVCSYVCPSRLPLLGAIREMGRRPVSTQAE